MNKTLKINPAFFFSILIGYFSISLALFFVFWIKVVFAIPLVIGLIISNFQLIRNLYASISVENIQIKSILLILLISFFSLILVGFGGIFEQKFDLFYRSNIVFSKLVFNDWPVLNAVSQKHYLSYYLGYFIIPSFFTKVLGFTYFLIIEFILNLLLLTIILLLFFLKFKNFSFFLFLIPSGIYWLIERYTFDYNTGFRFFNYLNVLAHGPQQLFPSLVGILFFIYGFKSVLEKSWIFILAILFFWSPFAVVGLGVLYLSMVKNTKVDFINSFGAVLSMTLLLFYLGKDAPIFFKFINFQSVGFNYILFIVLDLYVFLILFKPRFDNTFLFVLLFLSFLPFLHFGKYNDLLTKSSIPCIIYYYYWILNHSKVKWNKLTFIILSIYSITTLNHFSNLLKPYQGNNQILYQLKDKNFTDFSDQNAEIQNQYYSNLNSFFGTYLLKK